MAAVDVTQGDLNAEPNEYDNDVDAFRKDLVLPAPEQEAYMTEPLVNMDEEIKVTKKRKPVAKLDAERLLSERGVPELRRRANKRLKLGGKGNEFEDISNLLQMYQMWLDDMYPKAKFRDGLKMIEKLGHSKRLNVMRRAWITSTRPGQSADEPGADQDAYSDAERGDQQGTNDNEEPGDGHRESNDADQTHHDHAAGDMTAERSQDTMNTDSARDQPEEDELDALLAQESSNQDSTTATANPAASNPFGEDSDEDDLDALLDAETNTQMKAKGTQSSAHINDIPEEQDFADEEAVMNEMGIW